MPEPPTKESCANSLIAGAPPTLFSDCHVWRLRNTDEPEEFCSLQWHLNLQFEYHKKGSGTSLQTPITAHSKRRKQGFYSFSMA
jgi:hypothetical protein